MTARELVAIWPERWPRPDPYTTKNSASQLKHFAAFFEDKPLVEITRSDFRRFALAHPGAARYARTALADAFDEGLVTENVGAGVRIQPPAPKAVVVPSPEEIRRLIAAASKIDTIFGLMVEFSADAGTREGETRAITAAEIDLRTLRGRVEHSLNREERLKEPKTPGSKAPFALAGRSRAAAVFAMDYAAEEEDPRLFPFTYAERRALWNTTRYEAKLDKVKWHALRHFCATDLLNRGATVDDVALQLRCSVDEIRSTYGKPDREAALGRIAAL